MYFPNLLSRRYKTGVAREQREAEATFNRSERYYTLTVRVKQEYFQSFFSKTQVGRVGLTSGRVVRAEIGAFR